MCCHALSLAWTKADLHPIDVQILRPNQRALCIVRSFPFFPDSQALANWVAAGQGDHEAHSMMTMHATSSTTSYHSNS